MEKVDSRRGWSPPRRRAPPPRGRRTVGWAGNTSVLSYSREMGRLSSWRSLCLTQRGQRMDGQTWEGQTGACICALVLKPALSVSDAGSFLFPEPPKSSSVGLSLSP